tara:strand:+ start:818 stop:1003 length:186 start_codon:yes stop_codon:yes gene_type:complete
MTNSQSATPPPTTRITKIEVSKKLGEINKDRTAINFTSPAPHTPNFHNNRPMTKIGSNDSK